MFEDDYIMRIVKEMLRTVLRLIFKIDTEFPDEKMIENENAREIAEMLIKKVDEGHINEAENELYDLMEDKTNDNLLIGLVFYSHLNELDEDFLLKNDFSQEEIKDGLENLLSEFGIENIIV